MGFELDTKDMERRRVELRMHFEKEKRRFTKANDMEYFESIVKGLLDTQDREEDVLKMDRVSNEQIKHLSDFLAKLEDKCTHSDQHDLLESTLRASLKRSRRKSIGCVGGMQTEPICYFCASHLEEERRHSQANLCSNLRDNGTVPIGQIELYRDPTPPSSSAPTPDIQLTDGSLAQPPKPSATNASKEPKDGFTNKTSATNAPTNNGHPTNGTSGLENNIQQESQDQVPPSPDLDSDTEDPTGTPGAHEDSLHCWFQNTNEQQSPPVDSQPRASTPLSSPRKPPATDKDDDNEYELNNSRADFSKFIPPGLERNKSNSSGDLSVSDSKSNYKKQLSRTILLNELPECTVIKKSPREPKQHSMRSVKTIKRNQETLAQSSITNKTEAGTKFNTTYAGFYSPGLKVARMTADQTTASQPVSHSPRVQRQHNLSRTSPYETSTQQTGRLVVRFSNVSDPDKTSAASTSAPEPAGSQRQLRTKRTPKRTSYERASKK